MSARSNIVNALVEKIKLMDGNAPYTSNIFGNVYNKLKFWNEVDDYPSIYVTAGPETREYLPTFKWGHLSVSIKIYVKAEEPEAELEKIFADLEYVIDNNGELEYDSGKATEDINIMSINTDEGLLAPIGVGEINLHIQYEV